MNTLSFAPATVRARPVPSTLSPHGAFLVTLAGVALWTAWAAGFNTAQFGDNIEQFTWAQSLELGYHKHPPMPSWALGAVIRLFGPSVLWTYVLAGACLLGTAAFTWSVGRRLFGERVAGGAMLLWGLSLNFSQRAQLYNHNTVLVLFVAATVWAAMRAIDSERRSLVWWIATGVAAGAAMLSKYQALVPLGGLAVALAASGGLRHEAHRRGLIVAVATTILLCAPHAIWVVRNDFSTLRYASEAVEASGLRERLAFLVSFVANQLRLQSPALLAIGLCVAWDRWRPRAALSAAKRPAVDAATPIWTFGLVGFGLVVLAAMALGCGVSLRNHWGVQVLQFASLWVAQRWDRRRPIDLRRLAIVAALIHAGGMACYAAEHRDPRALLDARRIDTMYPARRMAQAALAHWARSTSCPLHYIAGSGFDAGLVSLYSGENLIVFDTVAATPWVDSEALRRDGALVVLETDAAAPSGVTRLTAFELAPADRGARPGRSVRIGVLMPQSPCDADIALAY